jgi:hypothetical protein
MALGRDEQVVSMFASYCAEILLTHSPFEEKKTGEKRSSLQPEPAKTPSNAVCALIAILDGQDLSEKLSSHYAKIYSALVLR